MTTLAAVVFVVLVTSPAVCSQAVFRMDFDPVSGVSSVRLSLSNPSDEPTTWRVEALPEWVFIPIAGTIEARGTAELPVVFLPVAGADGGGFVTVSVGAERVRLELPRTSGAETSVVRQAVEVRSSAAEAAPRWGVHFEGGGSSYFYEMDWIAKVSLGATRRERRNGLPGELELRLSAVQLDWGFDGFMTADGIEASIGLRKSRDNFRTAYRSGSYLSARTGLTWVLDYEVRPGYGAATIEGMGAIASAELVAGVYYGPVGLSAGASLVSWLARPSGEDNLARTAFHAPLVNIHLQWEW